MKKLSKFAALLLGATLTFGLMACGETSTEPETPAAEAKDITVTFMNGDEVLGTVSAKADTLVTGYESYENLDGNEFLGWFETPTFVEASAKDLTKDTFSEDETLYGCFKSTQVAEDTRVWYIVGDGASPLLKASSWAGNVEDDVKDSCTLKATGNSVNEFSITVDLFEGDQFQIIHDWSWDGQRGFGYWTEYDETQMENGGGLGGSDKTSNTTVLVDGNYTITLTTDPDNEPLDTMVIVRNGDPVGEAASEDDAPLFELSEATGVAVKGSWVSDWSEVKDLSKVSDYVFEITMDLDASTELYFMVMDNGTDTGIGMNQSAVTDEASLAFLVPDSYNVTVAEAGTYTFTVNAETLEITVTM